MPLRRPGEPGRSAAAREVSGLQPRCSAQGGSMRQAMAGLILFVVVSSNVSARAQRAGGGDVAGAAIEAYEVRPGFLLTVSRDGQGRVRQMVVEKAVIAGRRESSESFTERIANSLADELAPAAKRGTIRPSGNISCFMLCFETQEY